MKGFYIFLSILLIGAILVVGVTPFGRAMWNSWFQQVQEADDITSCTTKKQVEDTCRAMIASYTSDKLVYEQYLTSSDLEKHGWAEQAKMRANKTAASYNEYILKNDYVWNGNIPPDIRGRLDYLE